MHFIFKKIQLKLFTYLLYGIFLTICTIIFYFYTTKHIGNDHNVVKPFVIDRNNVNINQPVSKESEDHVKFNQNDIVLAVVACGDRLHETLTLLKSALMLSKKKLNFVVLAEDGLIDRFKEKLSEWQTFTNDAFNFKILPLTFPKTDADEWRKLFKPCAAQRLFLPDVLQDVDSVLYMDTDTLFLTPVETVWEHFKQFNKTQMAALAPEHEDANVSWYNRFAKHPYYGKLGVNSGVMLMNLTRMRAFQWTEYVVPIYKKYKLQITWGDQDIINIIFHYHPGKLYIYPCNYNYRPDHCMYTSVCKPAEKEGVIVLHGSRGFFHSENQPVFQYVFKAFEEFQLGGDIYKEFYQLLESYLEKFENTNCGHIRDAFLKNLRKYLDVD